MVKNFVRVFMDTVDVKKRLALIDSVLENKKICELFKQNILTAQEREYIIKKCTVYNKQLFLCLNQMLTNAKLSKEEAVMFCKQEFAMDRERTAPNLYGYFYNLLQYDRIACVKYFIKNINNCEEILNNLYSIISYISFRTKGNGKERYQRICEIYENENFNPNMINETYVVNSYYDFVFFYETNRINFGLPVKNLSNSTQQYFDIIGCVYETYKDEIITYSLKSQKRSIECLQYFGKFLNEEGKQKLLQHILKSKCDIENLRKYVVTKKTINVHDYFFNNFCQWLVYVSEDVKAQIEAKYILQKLSK